MRYPQKLFAVATFVAMAAAVHGQPLSSLPSGATASYAPPGSQARALALGIETTTEPDGTTTYWDTSLTQCPRGSKLRYFFYYKDIPQLRGPDWCAAAAADIADSNATEPIAWRIPYLLEACQPGVAWTYSHGFPDGSRYYSPTFRNIGMVCAKDECPVAALSQITDPSVIDYEDGQYANEPDIEHMDERTRSGAACIVLRAAGIGARAKISSGFRPQAYQTHIREVWDKWQLLNDDASESCRERKSEIYAEWKRHRLIRQPVVSSKHSLGLAVDIARVPKSSAETIASQCNMMRPEPVKDPVHFQPR